MISQRTRSQFPISEGVYVCLVGLYHGTSQDVEATPNDKFVALELLKNANVAAGRILPGCQDTGTAIIMGKKGQQVWRHGTAGWTSTLVKQARRIAVHAPPCRWLGSWSLEACAQGLQANSVCTCGRSRMRGSVVVRWPGVCVCMCVCVRPLSYLELCVHAELGALPQNPPCVVAAFFW